MTTMDGYDTITDQSTYIEGVAPDPESVGTLMTTEDKNRVKYIAYVLYNRDSVVIEDLGTD